MKLFFILLVIYQIKHFLADYPLQTKYMLGKFKHGASFFLPLLAHCSVHALFTLFITFFFLHEIILCLQLALFDLVIHFVMDRIKASPLLLGRFKALSAREYKNTFHDSDRMKSNTYFWWSLGLDQMVHHLTHYGIIYAILTNVAR